MRGPGGGGTSSAVILRAEIRVPQRSCQTPDANRRPIANLKPVETRLCNQSIAITMNNPEAAPTLALFDCPVCKERLSLPVTLPCGYSTCAPCLRGIVLSAKQSVETATSNVASPVTESPVSPTVPATAGQGTRDSSSSTSTTPAQPNPPQRMDSTTSITSNSSLIVDVSAGEKVYYPCPAPDCPYGDHLYRKEKTDFNLQRIIDGLPAGEKTREIQVDDIPMSELECPVGVTLI